MGYQAEMESFSFEHFDVARYQQTQGQNAQVIVESPIQAQSPGPTSWRTSPKGQLSNQGRKDQVLDAGPNLHDEP